MSKFVATLATTFGVFEPLPSVDLSLWDNNISISQSSGPGSRYIKEDFGGSKYTYDPTATATAGIDKYVTSGSLTYFWHYENGDQTLRSDGEAINIAIPGKLLITPTNMVQLLLSGNDEILGSPYDDRLSGGAGSDTITGGGGVNYLRGDDGNDSIAGGGAFDDINGNQGNDTAGGGGGDDWVVGGKDNDSLTGDAGDDIVYGNLGDDSCDGGDGADIVRGGQGSDIVLGGAGNDWLSGDRGDDTVTGGAGADIFHTFGDAGIDRVTDFNRAEGDRVMLDPGTTYNLSQVGVDTVISMGGGGQMILVGVPMASLTGDWIFGA